MSNQIREVKEATDIVQVIGERLQLQRSGRNLRALCPFHSEKSPSFFVSPEIQVFRCFGCGERGDVFTFLQKYEGLTFGEALRLLADNAGIQLTAQQFTPEDSQRERLLQLLDLSKAYFHYLLTEHKIGKKALQYVQDRGVTNETIQEFQLGYSPDSWDGLIKYLHGKKKYAMTDLLAAGVIIPRNNSPRNSTNVRDYYDRFRDRIMFPLSDHRGRVVGFSGRVLNPEEKTAKYINSPETLLYHKSQLLFGFSQHYRALREAQSAIVVEGEFDVLSSAQAHVRNVVAIKGSALTKEHLQRLQRVVNTIILSLDTDKAGIAATKRAIETARDFDIRIKVLSTQDLAGKDPDDMAREDPKAWREHIKKAISAYQFLINTAVAQHNISTGEGKQAVVAELAEVLLSIPHVIEQSHYIEELARQLTVSPDMLRKDLSSYRFKKRPSSPAEQVEKEQEWQGKEKVEAYIISQLVRLENKHFQQWVNKISHEWFSHSGLRQIFQFVQKHDKKFELSTFANSLPSELQPLFGEVYLLFRDEETVDTSTSLSTSLKALEKSLLRLRNEFLRTKERDLMTQLTEFDQLKKITDEQEAQQQTILIALQKLRDDMQRDISDPSLVKYKDSS